MRLSRIKLAGFKSFAEPTTFELPGQRVGVVGPNGCGKSNIMDAVRWVLGESKASELRGEYMQDVIFNGSAQRKQAGRASVELVFDNSDARAGGAWAQYQEIAVKRVLTRDGTSSYHINNQPVRRRDVYDVFLGTGLGPRAYAIIGQGTISRIIESRPEELRLFLEEAAGVSKYKERRREAESRLKDTRENLTRVDDILRELATQLQRLEQQAEVAGRYRALQDAGTRKLHQLWFLKQRDAAAEAGRAERAVAEAVNALEARTAELREAQAVLEGLRQGHYEAGDRLHEAQGALAEASLQVSRLEERIRYVVDARERAARRIGELQAQQAQWARRRDEARSGLDELADSIEDGQAQTETLQAQMDAQSQAVPALDEAWHQARQQAQACLAEVAQVQQQIQVLAAESRGLEAQASQWAQRRERLGQERRGLARPDALVLENLHRRADDAQARAGQADAELQSLQDAWPALEETRRRHQARSQQEADRLAGLTARLEALRALQAKVQTEGKLSQWLARHDLQDLKALWAQLQVEPGWEDAFEAVLRERLGALEVGRLETLAGFAADAPPARMAFFVRPAPGHAADASAGRSEAAAGGPLQARLRGGDPALRALLAAWLRDVDTAPDLAQALAWRATLGPQACIVTPAGHLVSTHAVAFHAPDSERSGLLARAQEIDNLAREVRAQALIADEARAAWVRADAQCTEAGQRLATARREAAEAQSHAHEIGMAWLRASQQAEAVAARDRQLDEELAEVDAGLEDLAARRVENEARFETLDLALADAQERHAAMDDEVLAAQRALDEAREQRRQLERQVQEAQFQVRALQARRDELERVVRTAQDESAGLAQAQAQVQAEYETLDDAAAQEGLQEALARRLACEQALGAARSTYDDLALRLRQGDERRLTLERGLEPLREAITQRQLQAQAAQLGGAQFLEQLQAAGADLDALAASVLEGGVRLVGLQGEIDRIQREMSALGAVNLAALDELGAARERKTFLDAQNADLAEAMATLEDAIRRIDLETRELLRKTFDEVNGHFGQMFPVLFGGGSARLVMTGEEILDAGVQVMAQPPGKRNATIHLLSGGEKALTAIALVFAIFQLNPAPFCLLDEVDAPLDDANTERYARLVTRMSEGTQFLFISHNKIAMEMAEQLIGVTMQEQGVSRIVAVDMESALGMAEAA